MLFTLSNCSLEENDAQKEESSSCTLIHCVSLLGLQHNSSLVQFDVESNAITGSSQ